MLRPKDDVIAAIATPIGEGGISIIRISGKQAIEIADRGFRGKMALLSAPTHTAHFGHFVDRSNNLIDEIVAIVYREPHSYTAENSVEINCHGGMFVTNKILESVIEYGARLAEPGEFTKRAYLNCRIDLSQAEAVAQLIQARSEGALKSSLAILQGELSNQLMKVRENVIDILALLESSLDFSEEGIEIVGKQDIVIKLKKQSDVLLGLINSYKKGKIHRDGIKIAIIGQPNVGKSSLMNCLLRENRVIVNEIPGTTRDTIEESITLDSFLVNLVDTAGIRKSDNSIEKEGISRAIDQAMKADFILHVIDASQIEEISHEDTYIKYVGIGRKEFLSKCILVLNKVDLITDNKLLHAQLDFSEICYVFISAKTQVGIDQLRLGIKSFIEKKYPSEHESNITITSVRHFECISKAYTYLCAAMDGITDKKGNELAAIDLRSSMNYLGLITERITDDEVINNIFKQFCIGK
jgi:tRNA modification GTPase